MSLTEPLLVVGLDEFMHNRGGGGEAGSYASLACRHAQADDDMGLPTPRGPSAMTIPRRSTKSERARPTTSFLLSVGIASKSKLSRRRCHVNHRVTSLWAPTPEIMQRSSLAATVSSRRRGIGGVFGGRPDGVGR